MSREASLLVVHTSSHAFVSLVLLFSQLVYFHLADLRMEFMPHCLSVSGMMSYAFRARAVVNSLVDSNTAIPMRAQCASHHQK